MRKDRNTRTLNDTKSTLRNLKGILYHYKSLLGTRPTRGRIVNAAGGIKPGLLRIRAQNLLHSRIIRLGHNHGCRQRLCTILYPSPQLAEQCFGLTPVTAPAVSECRNLIILVERSNVAHKVRHLVVVPKCATGRNTWVSLAIVSLKPDLNINGILPGHDK